MYSRSACPLSICQLSSHSSVCHAMLYSLCCAVLCCAVLCCAVLCCAVLCCAVLCCASTRNVVSDAGTVEAGAGAGGEGVKRKRSDDMAALEADLAPEPQAGMTQSPAPFSSPHLFQQSSLASASPTSISSLCLCHSTCHARQSHWWAIV